MNYILIITGIVLLLVCWMTYKNYKQLYCSVPPSLDAKRDSVPLVPTPMIPQTNEQYKEVKPQKLKIEEVQPQKVKFEEVEEVEEEETEEEVEEEETE